MGVNKAIFQRRIIDYRSKKILELKMYVLSDALGMSHDNRMCVILVIEGTEQYDVLVWTTTLR